ncbi:ABC transporter permease [Nocardioides bizhenqiangii]|uniref:ABC transporter permease subunit n=1 Tax=Nocardioides bizhenqiangii TaxID=3095076 RepID=A0ABZ0ZRI9_9ACTN|nr:MULTISPECIES: ABC transporter permease subunit [unclassified Nocardioides]MDZ5622654.1 ABC transporter permease subunit [Nocardioides sp. HM23]WQQ26921.1 ABC transporter permease subunit [Nocardioides sp. HM61]
MIGAIEFLLDGESWTRNNGLLEQLVQQLLLTVTALVLAVLVGLPIALVLGHLGRGGLLAINISNIGRAVPTFALLAVLVRLEWPGNDPFGPYGRAGLATLLALLFFALPPIITQAYVGVREVDAGVREAARGMGMSGPQLFWRVELPLAMPLVMSGVRLALVQVWATATIAALVGGPGLGNVIQLGFANLDRRSEGIGGAILVALIALVLELLAALAQRATSPVPSAARTPNSDQMSMLPPTVKPADDPVG